MFNRKTWKDRVTEYPNRRLLTNADTGEQSIVTVRRQEGTVTEAGDAYSADNMNDLETRINTEFSNVEADIATTNNTSSASTTYAVGDYLMYNGHLYIVTQAIAQGATINPGANCTQTSVGAQLRSLLRTLTTNINTVSNQVTSLSNSTNTNLTSIRNSITSLQNSLSTTNTNLAKKSSYFYWVGTNVSFSNGAASVITINASANLSGRVRGVLVTAGGTGSAYAGSLIDANVSACRIQVRDVTNHSFTGTVPELNIILFS